MTTSTVSVDSRFTEEMQEYFSERIGLKIWNAAKVEEEIERAEIGLAGKLTNLAEFKTKIKAWMASE